MLVLVVCFSLVPFDRFELSISFKAHWPASSSPLSSMLSASLPEPTELPQMTELPQTTLSPLMVEFPQITESPKITDEPLTRQLPQMTEFPQITELVQTDDGSATKVAVPQEF